MKYSLNAPDKNKILPESVLSTIFLAKRKVILLGAFSSILLTASHVTVKGDTL